MSGSVIRSDPRSRRLPSLEVLRAPGDPRLTRVFGQIKEILDKRFGPEGDILDKAITWGDLFDRGLLAVRDSSGSLRRPPYTFDAAGDVPLLIDTRSIVPNAVTTPVSVEASAPVVLTGAWQTLLSVPVDFGSVAPANVFLISVVNISVSGAGTANAISLRFTKDGTPFGTFNYAYANQTIAAALAATDVGGTGEITYEVEGTNGAGATYQADARSLLIIGAKR